MCICVYIYRENGGLRYLFGERASELRERSQQSRNPELAPCVSLLRLKSFFWENSVFAVKTFESRARLPTFDEDGLFYSRSSDCDVQSDFPEEWSSG